MTKDLVEKITAANAALFKTTARLLEAADEVKKDRQRLFRLLRQATPGDGSNSQRQQREGVTDAHR